MAWRHGPGGCRSRKGVQENQARTLKAGVEPAGPSLLQPAAQDQAESIELWFSSLEPQSLGGDRDFRELLCGSICPQIKINRPHDTTSILLS